MDDAVRVFTELYGDGSTMHANGKRKKRRATFGQCATHR